MKTLTEVAARSCEEALKPRCRCRCHGALHGKKRGGDNPPREFYENLHVLDPHYIKPKKVKEERVETAVQLVMF